MSHSLPKNYAEYQRVFRAALDSLSSWYYSTEYRYLDVKQQDRIWRELRYMVTEENPTPLPH